MPSSGSAMVDAIELRSASAIVFGTVTGHHVLHVEGYSRTKEEFPNGRFIKSRPFKVGSHTWHLSYYPNGSRPQDAMYISIYLTLDEDVSTPFKARAKFSLLDQQGNPVPSQSQRTRPCEYSLRSQGHGFGGFVEREFLEKSKYLKDDCFRIRCDVVVLEGLRTEDRPATSPFIEVPPSDLNQHLGALLAAQDGVDVMFQVAGETFWAHRNILAARSPVFKAELFGQMKEGIATRNCGVQIDDMLPQVFKALLHFIYTDSLPEMEGQDEAVMAQHLLEAADIYDMPRLKLICEDRLGRHLNVSTAATTLLLAEQHNCQGLKNACIQFLQSAEAMEAVMATDGFEHLTKSFPALVKELMYPFIQVRKQVKT